MEYFKKASNNIVYVLIKKYAIFTIFTAIFAFRVSLGEGELTKITIFFFIYENSTTLSERVKIKEDAPAQKAMLNEELPKFIWLLRNFQSSLTTIAQRLETTENFPDQKD